MRRHLHIVPALPVPPVNWETCHTLTPGQRPARVWITRHEGGWKVTVAFAGDFLDRRSDWGHRSALVSDESLRKMFTDRDREIEVRYTAADLLAELDHDQTGARR